MFDIRKSVDFDSSNRAICPACSIAKGTGYKAKNLSVAADSSAYKCHRGCTKEEIRAALGEERDRQIPAALAKPPAKAQLLTPQKVKEFHNDLLKSKEPLQWLLNRGFTTEMIQHYRLGLGRAQQEKGKFLPAITIPIPENADGTKYYQKKRVAPWIEAPHKPWSQYGIPATVWHSHKPATATATLLCEGEWDAMMLGWRFKDNPDIAVACFTCGASNTPEDLSSIEGNIFTLYDLDAPGAGGAKKLQDKLKERVFIATVPHPEEPKPGYDVSDALLDGRTDDDFLTAMAQAKPYAAQKKENPLRTRFLTNDEMIAEARDYVEWLVPDLFTADELFILGMPPRGGKSIFCLTLALSVAIGGTFLDRPVTQGSVIYINLEDAPTKVKQRQIAQQWGENLPVYWMDKFKLSELDSLKELADEIPDLRLVILDTFSRVRDDNQKESSAELGKTLEPLQEWAKERGICILITHHTSKAPTDGHSADPFDTLRGSTSIRATCRGAIVIVPAENGYRLLAENGYSDRLDVLVRINPETLKWKLMGNWAPRIDGDMKAQILDHITLMGEGTVSSIATALQFNAASVSTIMARLHRDGMVSKDAGKGRSPGVYSRSSNLLKLMEPQFEQPNLDTVCDTDLLKQDNLYGLSEEKVIIGAKSDHLNDHFSKNTPTQDKLFEQSYSPDPDSVVCSNSEKQSLSYGKPKVSVSSDVQYKGNPKSTLGKQCGKTVMKVTGLHEGTDGETYATVKAFDWTQTQTVAIKDLKLV
jgi:AAA domain